MAEYFYFTFFYVLISVVFFSDFVLTNQLFQPAPGVNELGRLGMLAYSSAAPPTVREA